MNSTSDAFLWSKGQSSPFLSFVHKTCHLSAPETSRGKQVIALCGKDRRGSISSFLKKLEFNRLQFCAHFRSTANGFISLSLCICTYTYMYACVCIFSSFLILQLFIFVLKIHSFFSADTKCKSHDMPVFQFFSILWEIAYYN